MTEVVLRHTDLNQTSSKRMTGQKAKSKTGIFHIKNPPAIVVMWRGQEMCRYDSMEEFVDSHLEGVEILENKQEDLLEDEYGDNT